MRTTRSPRASTVSDSVSGPPSAQSRATVALASPSPSSGAPIVHALWPVRILANSACVSDLPSAGASRAP